jgi:hypothetical protein
MSTRKTLGLVLGGALLALTGATIGYLSTHQSSMKPVTVQQEKLPEAASAVLDKWLGEKKRAEYEEFKACAKTELPILMTKYKCSNEPLYTEATNYALSIVGLEPQRTYSVLDTSDIAVNFFAYASATGSPPTYAADIPKTDIIANQLRRLVTSAQEFGDTSIARRQQLENELLKWRELFDKNYLSGIPSDYTIAEYVKEIGSWSGVSQFVCNFYSYHISREAGVDTYNMMFPRMEEVITEPEKLEVTGVGYLKVIYRKAQIAWPGYRLPQGQECCAVDFKPVAKEIEKMIRVRHAFELLEPQK